MIVMDNVSMKRMGNKDPEPVLNLVAQPQFLQNVQVCSHFLIGYLLYFFFLESFIDSEFVSVARNSDDLTFKTKIGTFSCTVGDKTEGEPIDCSKKVDEEAGG